MKRIGKRIHYIAFFCVIVTIALFSLETTMQLEAGDLIMEEIDRPRTRRGTTNDAPKTPSGQESSTRPSEEFISTPIQENTNTIPSYVEPEKKEETLATTSPSVEKASFPEAPKESTKEKKDETQDKEETEFSSIQSSGLTLANGDRWYFEEYDENGNIVSIVSYNKKKLLSKSQFEYNEEGKKLSATFTEPKKIIKLIFNDKGMEVGRAEYKKRKGQMGEVYSSHENIYDEKGRLQEEKTTENGITTKKVYTYSNKKMTTETVFENDVKTLFIEYKEDVKIVHIFDGEVELSVFEEALE